MHLLCLFYYRRVPMLYGYVRKRHRHNRKSYCALPNRSVCKHNATHSGHCARSCLVVFRYNASLFRRTRLQKFLRCKWKRLPMNLDGLELSRDSDIILVP